MHTLIVALRVAGLTLAALLPIINPPGSAPIFLSMTPGASEATRTLLARKVGFNSCLLLVAAMLVGSYVLSFFGLSLAVVKIAGGLLLISTGWHLITADVSADPAIGRSPAWGADEIKSMGFYPLTFPLTIGPGSVSVAMTLGAGTRVDGAITIAAVLGTLAGIVVAGLTVYLCYRFAAPLLRLLGETGSIVLLRLSAFILLAVGVEIFCNGLAERFALFRAAVL